MSRRDGCTGKVRHASRYAALRAAARMSSVLINVYRCPRCAFWHLGRSRDPVREAARIDELLQRHRAALERRHA
jgi:hypothetical protein